MPEPPPAPSTPPDEADSPARWLEDHGDALYRYALARLRNSHLAEDLVQDTLLAGWRNRDKFEGRSSSRTWLTGILRHKILDHWRRNARWQNASDLLGPDETTDQLFDRLHRWQDQSKPRDGDPVANSARADLRRALRHCLERLPTRLRQLFVLAEVEEAEREQLAAQFDLSNNHLSVLLYRARQRLRLCLNHKLRQRS